MFWKKKRSKDKTTSPASSISITTSNSSSSNGSINVSDLVASLPPNPYTSPNHTSHSLHPQPSLPFPTPSLPPPPSLSEYNKNSNPHHVNGNHHHNVYVSPPVPLLPHPSHSFHAQFHPPHAPPSQQPQLTSPPPPPHSHPYYTPRSLTGNPPLPPMPMDRPFSVMSQPGSNWPMFDGTTPPRPIDSSSTSPHVAAVVSPPISGYPPSHSASLSSPINNTNIEPDIPPCKYVVGIDFGTTQTGFGFCRVSTKKDSQPDIIANQIWDNQPQGTYSCKAPTIISYHSQDRTRKLFSWTAKMQGSDAGYERIERVKLCLEDSIPDSLKPTLPENITAIDVIADFLAWLREELVRMIHERYPMDRDLKCTDYLYCFTVPVGWSHKAHESLRQAAHQADLIDSINSRHLIFCYEPEAAALACVHESDYDIEPGSKMLVVDCGGGTVDLFLATLDENNDLEELTLSDGRFLGATRVDANFWNLIRQKVGLIAFERFKSKSEFRQYYMDMEWKWEYFKRQFTGKLREAFMITLPQPLLQIMPPDKVADLQHGDLYLNEEEIKSLFDPVVDEIINITKNQLQQAYDAGIHRINYLYVVGGFGCNAYVRKRVTEDSEVAKHVDYPMLPRRPEAAVLRGAVWCALNHHNIKSRKARKSIGIGVLRKYDKTKDNINEIVAYDPSQSSSPSSNNDITHAYVSKSVYVYVTKGQSVAYNARYIRSGYCIKSSEQRAINVCIWSSDSIPPKGSNRLETDQCDLIGTISIQLCNDHHYQQIPRFTIEISYGRVELGIRVIDESTGYTWNQFLNHGQFDLGQSLEGND